MKRESTVRKRIERTQVVRKIDKKRVRDLQRFESSSKNQRNEESERERENLRGLLFIYIMDCGQ